MFINYHYSKTLIFKNKAYKKTARSKVELNLKKKKKSSFKCYPLAILLLIYHTFHFNYFREEESRLNNGHWYNDLCNPKS